MSWGGANQYPTQKAIREYIDQQYPVYMMRFLCSPCSKQKQNLIRLHMCNWGIWLISRRCHRKPRKNKGGTQEGKLSNEIRLLEMN